MKNSSCVSSWNPIIFGLLMVMPLALPWPCTVMTPLAPLSLIVTVAPGFFPVAVAPLAWLMAALLLMAAVFWLRRRGNGGTMPMMDNPTELRSAIVFGALYALILLAVAYAREHLGDRGLYVVAGLSGLTDVDAITLSTSQMVKLNRMEPALGARLILLATMSNLLFKTLTIALLGHRRLLALAGGGFGVALLIGLFLLSK